MTAPFRDHAPGLARDLGPVLVLASGAKQPREGSSGVKEATRDPGLVAALCRSVPVSANVGVAGGDGLFVLDVDPRNGGDRSLRRLEADIGPLPVTVRSSTPGDGRVRGQHLFFRGDLRTMHPGGLGLDVISGGTYVVVPGSITPKGRYEWDVPPGHGVAEAPSDLIDWLTAHGPTRPAKLLDHTTVERLPGIRRNPPDRTWRLIREGLACGQHPERDSLLASVVLSLAQSRWAFAEVEAVVMTARYAVSEKLLEKGPTWAERELRRTWDWACALLLEADPAWQLGSRAIRHLPLPGKAGVTDRRVLQHLLDDAARHPYRSDLRMADGRVQAEVWTTKRTLALSAGISDHTAHASVTRLTAAGMLHRLQKGNIVGGVKTPSVFLMTIPIS